MKTYWISPADSSNPLNTFAGLAPTFTLFVNENGATVIPPGITESPAASGVYRFTYGATLAVFGQVDWGAGAPSSSRYTRVVLDPIQAVDERVGGIVNNNDSIGSTSVDPTTVIGFLKRSLEFWEGNATFEKSTGTWLIYDRGGTNVIRTKQLSNNATAATKT
ncbi:hypothetical protein [Microcystis sp. M061S2]|uniref:hypothetical protein n=1 Tax=Microcystis sp. M061S2 TaxID=2771171 RepID=UPI00258F8216|nr:hypothetical protein [Microcystis sp. M061S2]MCA2654575.1 hypothetical protein [Microcystis sp. M061S2]